MKKLPILASVLLLSLPIAVLAQSKSIAAKSSVVSPNAVQASDSVRVGSININNLRLKVVNDGSLASPDTGGSFPLIYPQMIYRESLFWVGKVHDGNVPEIRTGGGMYLAGVRPGAIISKGIAENSRSESARVYRYRPDYLTGDLTLDAALSCGVGTSKVRAEMVDSLRESYKKDVAEWPWQKGAPFEDSNGNGRMDPGEKPGVQNASQVVWFSYNDLDEAQCKSFAGDPPIGLEVQVTLWAYKGIPSLDEVIFKRYRLIYKGSSAASSTAKIDSMYLVQWVDPDIGYAGDDMAGCDSLLNLGYGYNGRWEQSDLDPVYNDIMHLPTPGIGYALLKGPLTSGGSKSLPMTSFMVHITGLGDGLSSPSTGVHIYYYWDIARGCMTFGYHSLPVDHERKPTRYMYYGDPGTRTGWIAARPTYYWYENPSLPDFSGGDVRFYLASGPFTMALGDTQEVVLAVVASAMSSSGENVKWLKVLAKFLQAVYPDLGEYVAGNVTAMQGRPNVPGEFRLEQNFPNPFNPSTQIRFSVPSAGPVKLSIFDMLGREIRVLYAGFLSAGQHQVTWDGYDASGRALPSGVYVNRLTQGSRHESRKMILLR